MERSAIPPSAVFAPFGPGLCGFQASWGYRLLLHVSFHYAVTCFISVSFTISPQSPVPSAAFVEAAHRFLLHGGSFPLWGVVPGGSSPSLVHYDVPMSVAIILVVVL